MTSHDTAGVSIPLRPAETGGGEPTDLAPASFSPSQRAADAWRSETNPESLQ